MPYLRGYGAARLATGVVALDKKALWSYVRGGPYVVLE